MSSSPLSSPPAFEGPDPFNNVDLLVQEPIITHLRPRRKRVPVVVPITPTRSRPSKRARQQRLRNDSSPPPALLSPYRMPNTSSPYVFDEDFYNNSQILNGDITPGGATYGAANNRHMKHMRQIHEKVVDKAQIDDSFEPLEMPDPPRPMETRLPEDCDIREPISFFELFFGEEQYESLARNTNNYARAYPDIFPGKQRRHWTETNSAEIKVYIALLIYMGINHNNDPKAHWRNPAKHSPVHHMKWKRYERLKSMFKVSDIDQDRKHEDVPGDWHFKLSPLDGHLQERFQAVVIPGSRISYDEMMIGFRGRSSHRTKVPNKPDPDGYKIWALCEDGYLYDWLYYSGSQGTCNSSINCCCN